MESIEVIAQFEPDGTILPRSFVWKRRTYRITSVGRRWDGRDGHHILVMTPRNRAYHLLFVPDKRSWFLITGGEIPTIPVV